jgi:hypothetical protein
LIKIDYANYIYDKGAKDFAALVAKDAKEIEDAKARIFGPITPVANDRDRSERNTLIVDIFNAVFQSSDYYQKQ